MRKRYGESQVNSCPFCEAIAIAKNKQGIPVCEKHKSAVLNDFKCICGEYLDIMQGKYGMFFNCMRCGPVSFRKALEVNDVRDVS